MKERGKEEFMKRQLKAVLCGVAVAALAVLLVACGSDDSGGSPPTAPPSHSGHQH